MTIIQEAFDAPAVATVSERKAKSREKLNPMRYLNRPFLAIDGEGMDVFGSHKYTLLAYKDGDEPVHSIESPSGLTTDEILEFLMTTADSKSIRVIYGGSYDFNMWVRDLPPSILDRLYLDGTALYMQYRLSWRRGKMFRIKDRDTGKTITIYDTISFFQRSFVKALDLYLGENWKYRDNIIANKQKRGEFVAEESADVAEYNKQELILLQTLMGELRSRLYRVGLRLSRWDGPGALAAALLTKYNIRNKRGPVPHGPADAAVYAYAGGRFEPFKYGHVVGYASQHDINSAYPAAIRHLPDLSRGEWKHDENSDYRDFALYRVRWKFTDPHIPGPLFVRAKNGTISYPLAGEGWYWGPEYAAARRYAERGYGTLEVLERWAFIDDGSRPFAFVQELYDERQRLVAAKDGAEVGLKLAANSIYGKVCQQVGYTVNRDGSITPPTFHSIEWAGYITASCRAQILDAIAQDPHSIIAIETDAVFTSAPLELDEGLGLGQWKPEVYKTLTYCQSGVYFADGKGGKAKTRGVDKGSMTESDALALMATDKPYFTVSLKRFTGLGIARKQPKRRWCEWETQTKELKLYPTGKRVHSPFCECRPGQWHDTICPVPSIVGIGHPYALAWSSLRPLQVELEEMRYETPDWE